MGQRKGRYTWGTLDTAEEIRLRVCRRPISVASNLDTGKLVYGSQSVDVLQFARFKTEDGWDWVDVPIFEQAAPEDGESGGRG